MQDMTAADVEEMCGFSASQLGKKSSSSKDHAVVVSTDDAESLALSTGGAQLAKKSSSSKDHAVVVSTDDAESPALSTGGAESIAKVLFHLELSQQLSDTLNCSQTVRSRPTIPLLLLILGQPSKLCLRQPTMVCNFAFTNDSSSHMHQPAPMRGLRILLPKDPTFLWLGQHPTVVFPTLHSPTTTAATHIHQHH